MNILKDLADKAVHVATDAAHVASDVAHNAADKAKHVAQATIAEGGHIVETVKETIHNVVD